jgi:hypothetical protein
MGPFLAKAGGPGPIFYGFPSGSGYRVRQTMLSLAAMTAMGAADAPVGFPANVVAWIALVYHVVTTGIMNGLHSVAQHTGIPVVVVAAAAIVLSFRFARRGARLAFEMAVALALVLLATKLGWIHW